MKDFLPNNLTVLFITAGLLIIVILLGFFLMRMKRFGVAISISWVLVITAVISEERLTTNEPAGFRMLAIIMVTLFAMKAPVTVETYKGREAKLSFLQWLAFSVGWFGMRPRLFESFPGKALPGARQLILFGTSRLLAGIFLIVLAKIIAINTDGYYYKLVFTGLLLVGLSFVLHFGILNISAGMWRLSGVDTRTLFRSPFRSSSLTEFWGKRWNLAFSEMTAIAVYRPLRPLFGTAAAMVLAFLFSGLLHEMAISVPVKTGYGLPMLYFVVQGILMLVEKGMERKGINISSNKVVGRAWVLFWLIVPMPILFHPAFIKQIVWPIIGL